MYEYLESEGIEYAIRLPANQISARRDRSICSSRPVGRPAHYVQRFYRSFRYQAASWSRPRRVVAKVEWHHGELFPRVGFIVTNLRDAQERRRVLQPARDCEQWIKEGKGAIKWTRLSCRTFDANAVRLQLHALAYNLGNFLRTLATPEPIADWSLTSLREKLIKIGAKVVSHGRYVAFQMAEVAIPRALFAEILSRIAALRSPPHAHERPGQRHRRRKHGRIVPNDLIIGSFSRSGARPRGLRLRKPRCAHSTAESGRNGRLCSKRRAIWGIPVQYVFFTGRGGSVGRGGADIRGAIAMLPPAARTARFKVTEQGEVIASKYGLPSLARRNLDFAFHNIVRCRRSGCDRGRECRPGEALERVSIVSSRLSRARR